MVRPGGRIAHSLTTFENLLSVPPGVAVHYAAKSMPYCRQEAHEVMEEVQQ